VLELNRNNWPERRFDDFSVYAFICWCVGTFLCNNLLCARCASVPWAMAARHEWTRNWEGLLNLTSPCCCGHWLNNLYKT
jgi:hypothetical protein